MNGIYLIIILVGLWNISHLVYSKSHSTNSFNRHILPTYIVFWLFVSIPLLLKLFKPTISDAYVYNLALIMSSLFIMVIPKMIESLIGRRCYSMIWIVVGSSCLFLNILNTIIAGYESVALILFSTIYTVFFIHMGYIRGSSPDSDNKETLYLKRFFIVTICFLPGIYIDISGLLNHIFPSLTFTPFLYLLMIIILIKLPESKKIEQAPIKIDHISDSFKLTNREIEIVKLILEGKSNKTMADELVISLSTIKRHVHNILTKFNVNSRFELSQKIRKLP